MMYHSSENRLSGNRNKRKKVEERQKAKDQHNQDHDMTTKPSLQMTLQNKTYAYTSRGDKKTLDNENRKEYIS